MQMLFGKKKELWETDESLALDSAISKVVNAFPGSGADDAEKMLKFIASAESNYGNYNWDTALSYGPYQMDPIRYYDVIQNKAWGQNNENRIDKANEFLRNEGYGEDFDLRDLAVYNPNTKGFDSVNRDLIHDPLVATTIARLALMQDAGAIPTDDEKIADYYFDFWGPRINDPSQPGYDDKRDDAFENFYSYNPEYDVDSKVFDALQDSTSTPALDSIINDNFIRESIEEPRDNTRVEPTE